MSANMSTTIAPLTRCSACRGWHRLNDLICPICGRATKLSVRPFFSRMPLLASVTIIVLTGALYGLFFGPNHAAQMVSIVVVSAWASALRYLWPKGMWGRKAPPRRVSISLRNVRDRVKEAQARTQLLSSTKYLTADLLLLGWRLSLLRHANRSAPLIYGLDIASVFARSEAELQRITVDQLHALDGSWISSRLSQREEGERALQDLAGLMAAVKARTGTYVDRLLKHDLGGPMPGIDIEEQILALQTRLEGYTAVIDEKYQQDLMKIQQTENKEAEQ